MASAANVPISATQNAAEGTSVPNRRAGNELPAVTGFPTRVAGTTRAPVGEAVPGRHETGPVPQREAGGGGSASFGGETMLPVDLQRRSSSFDQNLSMMRFRSVSMF